MKNLPAINSSVVGAAILVTFVVACVKPQSSDNQQSTASIAIATPTSPQKLIASPSPGDASVGAAFHLNMVCSLPAQASSGTPFAKLGGGTWRKWMDEGGDLDHSCEGGSDDIKLMKTSDAEVIAEYQVFGSTEVVHFVAVQYTALQYQAPTQEEKALRKNFAEFCNQLANAMFRQELPRSFTNKLLNEQDYHPAGTTNEYAQKVGTGYVNLSSNKNKRLMYLLNVKYFPSERDYERFKNS